MKKCIPILLSALILIIFSSVCAQENTQLLPALRFGHTPDYAPFAYSEGDGTSKGIDIEMMSEIARRMNRSLQPVPIEKGKMFDALYNGEVDVIGGALSVSDERAQLIDFTNIYYASDSIFVCLNAYYKPEQVTLYNFYQAKIGVEKGSNFEQWIENNLVKGNYIQRSDVYAYPTLTDAMKALDVAAVNLVIMDREPYSTIYEPTGKYTIFYQDVEKEEYAYGVRKDDPLRQVINVALQDMFNEGLAQNIASRYFNSDYSIGIISKPQDVQPAENTLQNPANSSANMLQRPAEAPAAPQTIAPAPSCTNDMGNIVEVSDYTGPVEPGAQFRRKWQFQNTGTCKWTKDYRFELASGTNMGTNGFAFPGEVAPGGYFEVYVDLVAPTTPGNYTSTYQLRSPQGSLFGQQAVLNLTVGTAPAPQPTLVQQESGQTPVIPQIAEFYASSNQGYMGDSITVYWSVSDSIGVQISVDGIEVERTENLNGSAVISGTLQSVGLHEIELAAHSVTDTSYGVIYYETLGE